MIELPKGWEQSTINDLIAVDGLFSDGDWVESKDQDPNGSNRLLQLADIGDGTFLNKSHRFVNDEKFVALNCTELKEGDVLVARMPDPLGRACLMPVIPQRCITVVDVAILRPGSGSVEPRWLMHFINSPIIRQEIELLSTGTTRKRISRGNLAQIELPVPPINEQKRIAAKLDALLARVDACRAHLERVPLLIKRFRQAVLAAATSGKLTEDWRLERGERADVRSIEFDDDSIIVPYSWEVWELNELIDPKRPLCYGVVQPGEEVAGGVPLIRVQDLDHWCVLADSLRTISTEVDDEYRRSRVKAGDLLISVVGTIGRTAIVPAGLKANIARAIARVSCRDEILSQWVNIWLSSDLLQWWLMKISREVARKTLNLSELGTTQIALPPLDEQREIVRRVEILFAYADRLEARYQAARARVEQLTPALLAKAFRGELVPQDPNDEPASVLLERIKAARNREAKPRSRAVAKPVAAPIKADATESAPRQMTFDDALAGLAEIFGNLPPSQIREVEFDPSNGHRQSAPDIDNYNQETLLGVIREVFAGGTQLDADSAIRAIARRLGYARTGERIHKRLKKMLRIAVQRGILHNGQGEYRLDRGTIIDYTQDECIEALRASISRGWTEREEAIRAASRYLGFRRTGPALREAFKSAINGAIRRGLLEYDKDLIRKIG